MTITSAHLEAIDRFLTEVGQESLFDYYGAPPDAPDSEFESRIGARRRWAQAQQANPKFRAEAVWLIRNQITIKKALLKERESYLKYCRAETADKNLELLSLFVRGTLFSGRFTADAEQAIRRQAARLDIPEDVLNARIDELLKQNDETRSEASPLPPTSTSAEDAHLNARVREISAQQLLDAGEVERILAAGREHQRSPHQIRVHLEKAILRTQGIETTPPPRRPATWQTVTPTDKDKLHELVDALRGAMMQDTLSESMELLLKKQAHHAGLSGEIWSGLLSTSKHHRTAFHTGQADPWQVLGLSNQRDRDEARRAYVQLRRWAWSHTDPLKCASTSLELDAAWTAVLRS